MERLPEKTNAFLTEGIEKGLNILVTGSDEQKKIKITNDLMDLINEGERIILVTSKDELIVRKSNVVNLKVKENIAPRDLVKASLRMSPNRVICDDVRECSFDILQAMNTGHDGSMGIANHINEVISSVQGSFDFPLRFVHQLIEEAVDIVIHLENEEIIIKSPIFNMDNNELEMVTLFETNNGQEIIHNVPLKQQIKDKYQRHEEWLKRVEEYKNKVPKTGYIKEINFEEFFPLFLSKYPFDMMDQLQPLIDGQDNQVKKMHEVLKREYKVEQIKKMMSLMKETVSIIRELKKDKEIPVGASKFGGSLDLPKGIAYPFYTEQIAYSFIMQINCEEYSKFDKEERLPKKGMLYFFHAFENQEIILPYDFKGKEGYENYLKVPKIFYYDGDSTNLERVEVPQNEHIEQIKSAKIDFVRSLTIKKPFENEEYYKKNGFLVNSDEEDEERMKILQRVLPRLVFEEPKEALEGNLDCFYDRPFHQLFGEAEHYQGPPEKVIKREMINDFSVPEEAEKEWILLFQLWEDEDINLYLGDGIIHYYLKKEDLSQFNFQSVYSTYECG